MRRFALGVVAVVLAGCASGAPRVTMTAEQRFEPEHITVEARDILTFVNDSDEAHTVTAYEASLPAEADYFSTGGFESEEQARGDVTEALIAPGEEFEVTFTEPGSYRYFCIPHEQQGMKGTVVVER